MNRYDEELNDVLEHARRSRLPVAARNGLDDLFETLGQIRELLTVAQDHAADIEDHWISQAVERMRLANLAAGNRATQLRQGRTTRTRPEVGV